nr:hypothetical protein P5627_05395 [Bacillus safensis]
MSETTTGIVNNIPADMSTISFLRLFSFSSCFFGDLESSADTIIQITIVTIAKIV